MQLNRTAPDHIDKWCNLKNSTESKSLAVITEKY